MQLKRFKRYFNRLPYYGLKRGQSANFRRIYILSNHILLSFILLSGIAIITGLLVSFSLSRETSAFTWYILPAIMLALVLLIIIYIIKIRRSSISIFLLAYYMMILMVVYISLMLGPRPLLQVILISILPIPALLTGWYSWSQILKHLLFTSAIGLALYLWHWFHPEAILPGSNETLLLALMVAVFIMQCIGMSSSVYYLWALNHTYQRRLEKAAEMIRKKNEILKAQSHEIQLELDSAREIQQSVLPNAISHWNGLEIAVSYKPMG